MYDVRDMLSEAARLLVLLGLPVILGCSLAALVVSLVQGATGIRETSMLYAARLAAAIVVLGVALPSFVEALLAFTLSVYQ